VFSFDSWHSLDHPIYCHGNQENAYQCVCGGGGTAGMHMHSYTPFFPSSACRICWDLASNMQLAEIGYCRGHNRTEASAYNKSYAGLDCYAVLQINIDACCYIQGPQVSYPLVAVSNY